MAKTETKTETKPAYETGKFYKVKLARAIEPVPGLILRPGSELRVEGALLEKNRDAVLEAREDRE